MKPALSKEKQLWSPGLLVLQSSSRLQVHGDGPCHFFLLSQMWRQIVWLQRWTVDIRRGELSRVALGSTGY